MFLHAFSVALSKVDSFSTKVERILYFHSFEKITYPMYRIFFLSLLIVLGISPLRAQKTLPSVELRTLEGRPVNITNYLEEGHPVVLSFWASWCKPCHRELNAFHQLYGQWQERFGARIIAVTIDTRRQLARAKSYATMQEWDFILLSDQENRLKNVLNFQTIPQTYIIQPDGTVVYESNGYVPGAEKEIEKKLMEIKTGE